MCPRLDEPEDGRKGGPPENTVRAGRLCCHGGSSSRPPHWREGISTMRRLPLHSFVILCSLHATCTWAAGGPTLPAAFRAPARLADAAELPPPSAVHLDGYLGQRVASNERNRLLAVDEAALLEGFRHRPGKQAWIGEHVGKWLHAATLAWAYTGDRALKAKLDRVAAELIKTQEPDGYLGTYIPGRRFGLYP